MALSHNIIETRSEGNRWLTRLRVVDSDSGLQYIRMFQSRALPDQDRLDELGALAKTRIQNELGMDANPMNFDSDLVELKEDLHVLKLDIIQRIRQYPNASLQQAQEYLDARYPEYSVVFPVLYAKWKKRINVSTWAAFKTWVITKPFRDID